VIMERITLPLLQAKKPAGEKIVGVVV